MHLDDDPTAGVLVPGGGEHAVEGGRSGQPLNHRGVGEGLVHHQHDGSVVVVPVRGQPVRRVVVLGQSGLHDALTTAAGSVDQRLVGKRVLPSFLSSQERLEPRRRTGVVVDAPVVDHQRQGWLVGAHADRPQKAVLQGHVRQLVLRREGPCAIGGRLVAPADDGVELAHPSRGGPGHDALGAEEGLEPTQPQQAP